MSLMHTAAGYRRFVVPFVFWSLPKAVRDALRHHGIHRCPVSMRWFTTLAKRYPPSELVEHIQSHCRQLARLKAWRCPRDAGGRFMRRATA
jgi:hypothetical protein